MITTQENVFTTTKTIKTEEEPLGHTKQSSAASSQRKSSVLKAIRVSTVTLVWRSFIIQTSIELSCARTASLINVSTKSIARLLTAKKKLPSISLTSLKKTRTSTYFTTKLFGVPTLYAVSLTTVSMLITGRSLEENPTYISTQRFFVQLGYLKSW